MKICVVVEGAYPYIQGGVSSWVGALISQMPEHEFIVQTIAASRKESGKFKCKIPPNVTAIHESFLQDDDIVEKKSEKVSLSREERLALKSLVFGKDENWEVIFKLFNKRLISLNDLLMGKEFFDIVREFYDENYNRVVFTDFLWTCRSMFLPIFTMLKSKFPEADIYHTVSTGYAGIAASCAGYLYNKPVFLTEHGIYTREREEEIIRANWTRGIYKDLWINHFYMLSRCIYDRANRVFSIFGRARDIQIELGCPEEKTEVIHNGINYDAFQNIGGKDENDEYVNVGAVVRVTPIKDIKTLINAFHGAKERNDKIKLYIIGNTEEDPDYYQECVELIDMFGTQDIIFTGHVNLREYMGKMDIVILTSISEGQPLSLLEAMAAAKPCIATKVGDCYDMLDAGNPDNCAGIIAPVMNIGKITEAIIRLAADENLRKKMGENGRKMVDKQYRDTAFIERYKEVYLAVNS